MFKQTVYYAHCMAIYDTQQEREDVGRLRSMGFRVVNPNSFRHKSKVKTMKKNGKTGSQIMDYFITVVNRCDGLAFRAIPEDFAIPAGVAKEIKAMKKKGGFILELPTFKHRNYMSIASTSNYTRRIKCQSTLNKSSTCRKRS